MNKYWTSIQETVEEAWEDAKVVLKPETHDVIHHVIRGLERGEIRVSHPADLSPDGASEVEMTHLKSWVTASWIKKAILLMFRIRSSHKMGSVPNSYFDKLGTRYDFSELGGPRVVPPGVVREGAYVHPSCIVMPGFVNIGAYVSQASMVDTWATVGSCAQVGKRVHIAGGVGIGGVLEPPNANPVLIGDDAFLGSRCIIVEGAMISEGAVLGANVTITASTPIYDVTLKDPVEYRGFVPPRAVVVPGTRAKEMPGGTVQLACSYIIAYRSESTDHKLSLNSVLRETGIAV